MVVALMATISVNAQNGYDETKHEVAVSWGALSNSQWIDVFEDMATIIVGASYKNEHFLGPIGAEYFYHAKNWLGVGGIFVYGRNSQDLYLVGTKDGKINHSYLTVMPAVNFDWLRKKNFGLYSKLGVGATLRTESFDSDNPQVPKESDSEIHVNWQVSALGLEVGSPTFRGFLEVGTGEQGTAIIGLRYKF